MIMQLVGGALEAARAARVGLGQRLELTMPAVSIETPAQRAHGDYSCNIAMLLARQEHLPAHQIAARIIARLPVGQGVIQRAEIAGPGFLNLFVAPEQLHAVVRSVLRKGADYGRSDAGAGRRMQVEFVSANPNGPLHIGHGRAAALGDTIARLLDWAGWEVTREYYINDATNSTQMVNFGRSLYVRYLQALGRDVPMPEDSYEGEYVTEIARRIADREGDRYLALPEQESIRVFTELALREMLEQQRADLRAFGVEYDEWFSEQQLHDSGAVRDAVELLKKRGWAYEAEGAIWLRSTALGDEKDRVLVRGTGAPTYLAADAAYHRNKFDRGFDKVIDIWGPDHHGYVARTKAVVAALGIDPDRLEILIHQIVRLFKAGEMVRMSKRAGDIIPLSDLVEEVGRDAARYFFLMRKADSHLDFDIDLAKKESQDNPVYYVQYAHARVCSILRKAEAEGVALPNAATVDLAPLGHESERELIRRLADLPEEVSLAAETYQPHRLALYAQDLATAFHAFYDTCRVLGEGVSPELTAARLALVGAARIVLSNTLGILGVSAPERM